MSGGHHVSYPSLQAKRSQGATYCEEEVTDIVGDVDGQAHVGEVETVAQGNEGQADNVVADQLLKVLAGLLQAQQQDYGLLGPVGGLEQVVELEDGLVGHVREVLVHAGGVEVPDGGAAHDVHAGRAQDAEVKGRVGLLHEARLLALGADVVVAGEGA